MFNKILTNLPALNAQNHLKNANEAVASSLERLASGHQLNSPGTDPSGLAISGQLEAEIAANEQGDRNLAGASGMFNVAEGALGQVSNLLTRTRELAIQAASDALEDEEREAVQLEANEALKTLQKIAASAHFRDRMLLTNEEESPLSFQFGERSDESNRLEFDLSQLNVKPALEGLPDAVDLSDPDAALDSLDSIDEAMGRVETARAAAGAYQNRVESVRTLLANTNLASAARLSRIQDTDYAKEVAAKLSAELRARASLAVLVQANQDSGQVLKLLEPQ